MTHVTLKSGDLELVLDPGFGGDILSIKTVPKNQEILLKTPWADRAEGVITGEQRPFTSDPVAHWMEHYRGGWQMITPNAGHPREIHGAPVGFHGEAAISTWTVLESHPHHIRISLDLISIPVRIEREISLEKNQISIKDQITNLSSLDLEFDYSSHPAFGGTLLDGEVSIETSATKFTLDEESDSSHGVPGSTHQWPLIKNENGSNLDVSKLPTNGSNLWVFGWLSEFAGPKWYRVINKEKNLTFEMRWESQYLDFAWFWLEFNSSQGFPWFGRVRTFAIEPSSTQTSGKSRKSILNLTPYQSTEFKQKVTVTF
ncbi:MAG: hypothetical protein ACKOPU_06495 [Candidatus Planktophila sp.]